jgi:hypothetical protein
MATYHLEIDLDNAAFGNEDGDAWEGAEVARILRELADRIEGDEIVSGRVLLDVNGNCAGESFRAK